MLRECRESRLGVQENSLTYTGKFSGTVGRLVLKPPARDQFHLAAFCFGHAAFAKVTCSVFIFPCGVSISVMEHFRSAAFASVM